MKNTSQRSDLQNKRHLQLCRDRTFLSVRPKRSSKTWGFFYRNILRMVSYFIPVQMSQYFLTDMESSLLPMRWIAYRPLSISDMWILSHMRLTGHLHRLPSEVSNAGFITSGFMNPETLFWSGLPSQNSEVYSTVRSLDLWKGLTLRFCFSTLSGCQILFQTLIDNA